MNRIFHFSRNGTFLGKHTEEDINKLIRSGLLKPSDDYWTKGMKAWAKVSILYPKTNVTAQPNPQLNIVNKKNKYLSKKFRLVLVALFFLLISAFFVFVFNNKNTTPKDTENVLPSSTRYQGTLTSIQGFTAFSPYGQEIFPSKVISYSMTGFKPKTSSDTVPNIGSIEYISGVIVNDVQAGDTLEVEVSGDRFIKTSKIKITVNEAMHNITVGPAPCYDFEALNQLKQTTPFNITIKAKKNDGETIVFNEVWQAHQINDCPINLSRRIVQKNKTIIQQNLSTKNCIAGYVNENHPMIESILLEAKASGKSKEFFGYAQGEDKIVEQIESIWNALQKRGVTYSNISESTISPLHSFQHIRLLEQSISEKQSNCLDGSVMLASILRKIGLNVSIILIPKHAYLAVYDSSHKRRIFAIETTMISKNTIFEAIAAASKEGEASLLQIESLINDERHPEYCEVDIQVCREIGIQPIPYNQ
jgi:hypothetical protein